MKNEIFVESHLGVEAWRGAAALMVVFVHLWDLSGSYGLLFRFGFTGVDLFFVLSGFVFAPYFFGKPLSVRAFAIRRFFRIYPAFVLSLAVYMTLKWQAGHDLLFLTEHLTFTYLQSKAMAGYYNLPYWSLPSEVEFYILLPLLSWMAGTRRWGLALLLALALAMRLWVGFMSDRGTENLFFILNHHLPGLLLEFLLGVLAWWLCRRPRAWAWRRVWMAAGLLGWLILSLLFGLLGDSGVDATWLRGQMSWMAALCFALLVAGSLVRAPDSAIPVVQVDRRHPTGPVVGSWLAQWGGRLSYGVYLFHMAAWQMLMPWREALQGWPWGHQWAALAMTFGMAWLCLRFCEDPLRRWGRRLAMQWEK